MDNLRKTVLCHFATWLILIVVCSGQDSGACDVIPKKLTVTSGSNVTVVFKAPSRGICRERIKPFSLSNVFWTLNSKKIEESYYDHNLSYAAVTISNFSLESGTVECHMHEQVLGGTIVRTHTTSSDIKPVIRPPEKPTNISCVVDFKNIHNHNLTCVWDNAGNSLDTTYEVTVCAKNSESNRPVCSKPDVQRNSFKCVKYPGSAMYQNISITVTAENSAGNVSVPFVVYPYERRKFKPPKDISVNPLPTSLSVSWSRIDCLNNEKCEVRCVEDGTNVSTLSDITSNKINVDDVKPCTKYTITVRCKCSDTLWTDWSTKTTVLSKLNASSVPIHLWRRVLKQHKNGTRLVQLMWKGPSPSCEAVDKYWLFVDSSNHTGLEPTQNHTSILLTDTAHEIRISAYKSNTALRHSFLRIPVTEKDNSSVRNPLATPADGIIFMSWVPPSMPVTDYVIDWFTDGTQEDSPSWVKTQEINISIPDLQPYKLYTVTITPLYGDEPGQGRTVYAYSKQGAPAKVAPPNCTADDTQGTVSWQLVRPDQCCGFVVNYTVVYRTSNEQEQTWLNKTVRPTSHEVILKELQPSTMYSTSVRAYSAVGFSESDDCQFQTEAYGKAFILKLIYGACGLALLLVLAVFFFMLWRRMMNHKVPDPQFSSMAMWSPEKSMSSFSNNPDLDNSENILLCHIDTEMDARPASSTDKGSPQHPSEDWMSDSGVALDTSASCRIAEDTGLTVSYKLWEAESKSPESNTAQHQEQQQQQHQHHQQPSRASPSPSNPYLDQRPPCGGCRSPSGEQQGPGLSEESQPGVGVSQQRASSTSSPGTTSIPVTTYVSVDMLDGQREG